MARFLRYVLPLLIAGILQNNPVIAATTTGDCQVAINEFVAAKQTAWPDDAGDYPDWIELYNSCPHPISLNGWALSDRATERDQWHFPDITLGANEYLVVWASGKNRRNPKAPLHTNFKIKAAGEVLYLSDETGALIDQTPPLALAGNQSAGRFPDGFGALHYFSAPTPGESNTNPEAIAALSPPIFSHNAGFYETAFELSLSHPNPKATIYYTLDGSEPDPDNLAGSTYSYKNEYPLPAEEKVSELLTREYKTHLYKKPITIRDRSVEPDQLARISTTFDRQPEYFPTAVIKDNWVNRIVDQLNRGVRELNRAATRVSRYYRQLRNQDQALPEEDFFALIPHQTETPRRYLYKGVPVRAIAVLSQDNQRIISPIASGTWLVGKEEDFTLPVLALTVPEPALFDYDDGLFVAGRRYDEWLTNAPPNADLTKDTPANWLQTTRKIPAHLSFLTQGEHCTNQNITIKVHGQSSRKSHIKSIRAYPDLSQHPVGFSCDLFNTGEILRTERINFRNAGGEDKKTYFKDAVVHEVMAGLNFGTQRRRSFVFFLNGEYYGILHARDRKDKYYLQHQYHLPDENITLLKVQNEPQHGNNDDWLQLLNALKEATNPNDNKFLRLVNENISIASLIDYFSAQLYMANTDWPGNNIAWWKTPITTPLPHAMNATVQDGRWRWLLYDTDMSFNEVHKNMLTYATQEARQDPSEHNPPWSTELLRTFLKNDSLQQQFIIRFSDLLNTSFHPNRLEYFIRRFEQQLEEEMPRHIHRWGAPLRMGKWRSRVNAMVEFAQKRPDIQRQHLQDYFTLGGPYTVTIDVTSTANQKTAGIRQGTVVLNTLELGLTDEELPQPIAANEQATQMAQVLALPWQGQYFSGMPITLTAKAAEGYRFSHWSGAGMDLTPDQTNAKTLTLTPNQDFHLTAVMEAID